MQFYDSISAIETVALESLRLSYLLGGAEAGRWIMIDVNVHNIKSNLDSCQSVMSWV